MRPAGFFNFFLVFAVFIFSAGAFAQSAKSPKIKSPASEETTPEVIKHLPDGEMPLGSPVYIPDSAVLRNTLGDRPVLNLVSFVAGTDAVTANYNAGKLLIVEYGNPQLSVEADAQIRRYLTENPQNPPVVARRVGNYEVFVLDATDETAANALIDQVKYEKSVQWLGQDPHLFQRAERAYLEKTSNVFVSTIVSIVLGLGLAACLGIAVGLLVFYTRKRKRASMHTFSDAGGMVRLNLDDLTPEISANRLLKD